VFVIKPACVAVLVPGLSSIVPRQDQISDCLFLFVSDLYFLILHYYTVATWQF
jgi:hypothetical protein